MNKDVCTYQHLDMERRVREMGKITGPSICTWLLKHGRFFEPAELSASRGLKPMTRKECFSNCANVAIDRLRSTRSTGHRASLYYCEGYALGSVIPVNHAWLCTPSGVVQDPTWTGGKDRAELGTEYFGVAFDTKFLMRFLCDHGTYGLLDNLESNFVVIREKVKNAFHWPLYAPFDEDSGCKRDAADAEVLRDVPVRTKRGQLRKTTC